MCTCGHFPHVPHHPPHTHILQIMLKDNNQKYREKLLEQQQNTKILIRRRPFHYVKLAQANYNLNLFHAVLCAVGYSDMHASKYNTDASFVLQTQSGPLQFLIIHKNHGPKQCITILKNNNTSRCIKIWHTCNKPPKIDHAKISISNVLHIFSLLSFWYRVYWSVNPWGTWFTWSHPRWIAF